MVVAAGTVHLRNGFFAQNGGYEYTLVLAIGALAFGFTGPGALSLDAAFGLELYGVTWGFGVLLFGLAGGALQLAGRQKPVAA
jgi:putative oxidoreductase